MVFYEQAAIPRSVLWEMRAEYFFHCLHEIEADTQAVGDAEGHHGEYHLVVVSVVLITTCLPFSCDVMPTTICRMEAHWRPLLSGRS